MKQTVMPVLRVTSAAINVPFYVDGLDFTVDWEYRHAPDLPLFAQLTRDNQSIFLSEHADDCQVGGAVHFMVADVDAWYRAFLASGLVRCRAPQDMPWKTRDIVVIDPDGNRLTFSTDLAA